MSQTSEDSWIAQDLGETGSDGIFAMHAEGSIPHQKSESMNLVDEVLSTGDVPPQIKQPRAQTSGRPVLLTRPNSSHQDPASGFTFAKARPAQLFDFSRRPMMNSDNGGNKKTEQLTKSPKLIESAAVQPEKHSSLIELPESESTALQTEQRNGRIDANLLKVQYPLVRTHLEREGSPPAPKPLELKGHAHQESNSSSCLKPQPEINPHRQHKRQPRDQVVQTPAGRGIKNEDLLRLMMFRTQKENDEREKLTKLQHVQAEKILECEVLNNDLKEALNNAKSQLVKMENDSQHQQARRSALEMRFRKLKDFLNGLSNDHNGLRDEARQLRITQESLRKDRLELQGALHDLKAKFQSQETSLRDNVNKAYHKVTLLEETVRTLEGRLCESQESLEQERTDRRSLGEEMERLSESFSRLGQTSLESNEKVLSSLQTIAEHQNGNVSVDSSVKDTDILSSLSLISTDLADMKTLPVLGPHVQNMLKAMTLKDFENAWACVRTYLEDGAAFRRESQQQHAICNTKLQEVLDDVTKYRGCEEQVEMLRELKISTAEQKQAAELSLEKMQLENSSLRLQEQNQIQKIAILETQAKQIQQQNIREQGQYNARIDKLESELRELESRNLELTNLSAKLSHEKQAKDKDCATLNCRLQQAEISTQKAVSEANRKDKELTETRQRALEQQEALTAGFRDSSRSVLEKVKEMHRKEVDELRSELTSQRQNSLTLVTPAEWESLRAQNISLERSLSLMISSFKNLESEAQKQAEENKSLVSLNKSLENKMLETQAKDKEVLLLKQRVPRVQSPRKKGANLEGLTITPRVVEVQQDEADQGSDNPVPQGNLVRIMQESASKAGVMTSCSVQTSPADTTCTQGIGSIAEIHDNWEQDVDFSEFINTQEAFGPAASNKINPQHSSDSASVVRFVSKPLPQSTRSLLANPQLGAGLRDEATGQELQSNTACSTARIATIPSDPSNPQLQSSSGGGNLQQATKRKAAMVGPAPDTDVLAGRILRRTTTSQSRSPSITSDSQSQPPERRASLAGRGQKLSKAKLRRDSKVDRRFRQELGQNSQG